MRAARRNGRPLAPACSQATRRRGTAAAGPGWRRARRRRSAASALTNSPHRRDEGRQTRGQRGGAVERHVPRAALVEDEADGVGAGVDGGVDVCLAGEAADLDAGAVGGHGARLPATASAVAGARRRLPRLRPVAAAAADRPACALSPASRPRRRPAECRAGRRSTGRRSRARRPRRSARRVRAAATPARPASQPASRRPPPTAHQRAHQVAHHVVQEGVGLEVEAPVVAPPVDVDRMQRLHRRRRLALGRAEGAEVVLADQHGGGFAQRRGVERPVRPAGQSARQPWPGCRLDQQVAVAAAERGIAGMERCLVDRHAPTAPRCRRAGSGWCRAPTRTARARRRCRDARPG